MENGFLFFKLNTRFKLRKFVVVFVKYCCICCHLPKYEKVLIDVFHFIQTS